MKLKLEIDMSNAAFEDNGDDELVFCLNRVATRIAHEMPLTGGRILDSNGNHVGDFKFVGK